MEEQRIYHFDILSNEEQCKFFNETLFFRPLFIKLTYAEMYDYLFHNDYSKSIDLKSITISKEKNHIIYDYFVNIKHNVFFLSKDFQRINCILLDNSNYEKISSIAKRYNIEENIDELCILLILASHTKFSKESNFEKRINKLKSLLETENTETIEYKNEIHYRFEDKNKIQSISIKFENNPTITFNLDECIKTGFIDDIRFHLDSELMSKKHFAFSYKNYFTGFYKYIKEKTSFKETDNQISYLFAEFIELADKNIFSNSYSNYSIKQRADMVRKWLIK